jgi:PKD repeat protein
VDFDGIYTSTAPFILWANLQSSSVTQHFDGLLDEWRAYDRALSKEEIEALMATNLPEVDFSASPVSGSAPLTVTFTDVTSGVVTSHL